MWRLFALPTSLGRVGLGRPPQPASPELADPQLCHVRLRCVAWIGICGALSAVDLRTAWKAQAEVWALSGALLCLIVVCSCAGIFQHVFVCHMFELKLFVLVLSAASYRL